MLVKTVVLTLFLLVSNTNSSEDYNRRDWGRWIDTDGDCQDTRQEVLIQESLVKPILSDDGCKVLKGRWLCPYTGQIITDPKLIDIDHMVPLKEAHESGGYKWPETLKKEYFNYLGDPEHLIAVHRSANRSKGSRSPDKWMPKYVPYHCAYLEDWINEKSRWQLKMDEVEGDFIIEKLTELGCYE